MKLCVICGSEIIPGINGCTMYDECSACRPIVYYAKPRQGEDNNDYESAILARSENDGHFD